MRILDSRFKYINAAGTDIRKLFDRVQPGWNRKRAKVKPRKARLPDNVRKLETAKHPFER